MTGTTTAPAQGPTQSERSVDQPRPLLIDVVRQHRAAILEAERTIEAERRLPDEIGQGLYEGGVYRAFMPRSLGGLEASPVEWLDAVEEVSSFNGSVGWLCMVHTGQPLLSPPVMERIVADGRWISASSARIGGRAVRVPGGYRVSGRWPFCSGSADATHLSGNAAVFDGDEPVMDERTGEQLVIEPVFPRSEVILNDTWHGHGLRGTSSGEFEVREVVVSEDMLATLHAPYDLPVLRYPFMVLAHGAHALGLARAAVDEFVAIAHRWARGGSVRGAKIGGAQAHQIAVARADVRVRAAKQLLWALAEQAYQEACAGPEVSLEVRARLHQANVYAMHTGREVVLDVFAQAGPSVAFQGHRLERILRDVQTAAQHDMMPETTLDSIGQYLFTRDLIDGPQVDSEDYFFSYWPASAADAGAPGR